MKCFTTIFIICYISSEAIGVQIGIEDNSSIVRNLNSQLREFLEVKLREIMKNGQAELEVPILDPLEGDEQEFNVQMDPTMLAGKLNNFHVAELSKYKVIDSNLNVMKHKLFISLHFPQIMARGLYKIDGLVGQTPIFGSGDFNTTLKDFSCAATVTFGIFGGVQVKTIDLKIKLREIKLLLIGLLDDEQSSWIVSEVLSDMTPKLIDKYHDKITAELSKIAIREINEKLKGKSWKDLLAIIS